MANQQKARYRMGINPTGGKMNKVLIAVPSERPGGLDSPLGAHFGHCDLYTLVSVEQGIKKLLLRFMPVSCSVACLNEFDLH